MRCDLEGEAQTLLCPLPQIYPFLPTVVDGVLLPKMPEEMLAEKNFNPVPYIVGVNKQEFGWILPLVRNSGSETYLLCPTHHTPICGHRPLSGTRSAVRFIQADISMETISDGPYCPLGGQFWGLASAHTL